MNPTPWRMHRAFLILAVFSVPFVFAPALVDQPARAQSDDIRIVTDLPSNRPLNVEQQENGSFRISLEEPRSEWKYYWKWWMIRVDNAKGETLTIELYNEENGHKWKTLHPVYMNGGDVRDPNAFRTTSDGDLSLENTGDGLPIPETTNQEWNFMRKTSGTDHGLKFTHTFESDRVWVAMRYPFLMSMANRYYERLKKQAKKKKLPLHVHHVGHTENGHRMRLFQVGSFPPGDSNRPTAVLYGREHATDHDAAWTLVGALEYLLSDAKKAKTIRKKYNIFVIPTLDREAAHQGIHHDICKTFRRDPRSRAATNYMNWFRTKWIEKGGRVDFVFDLHNYESSETDNHLKGWLSSGDDGEKFHKIAMKEFAKLGYSVKSNVSDHGYTPNRFAGRVLSASGGGVPMYYMVNSQAPSRHLTLHELKSMGTPLVRTTSRWLSWWEKTSEEENVAQANNKGTSSGNNESDNSKEQLKDAIERVRRNHNLDPYLSDEFDELSPNQQLVEIKEALRKKREDEEKTGEDTEEKTASDDSDQDASEQSGLVGQKAPDFSLKTLDGTTFQLSDQFGKHVVILDFWATWCGPCVKSMPILTKVAEKYHDRGVRFVGVNQKESVDDIKSFMKKHDLDARMVRDTDSAVAKKYGVRGIPHTVIIDRSGTVRFVHVGYQSGLKGIIESDVKKILNEGNSKTE